MKKCGYSENIYKQLEKYLKDVIINEYDNISVVIDYDEKDDFYDVIHDSRDLDRNKEFQIRASDLIRRLQSLDIKNFAFYYDDEGFKEVVKRKSITKNSKLNNSIIISLVGSHNYNLNDENSDKDYKFITLPSFDDLYEGRVFSESKNNVLIYGEESDYSAHDIRKFINMLYKSNINFLEVLFSDKMKINHEAEWLIEMRDEIARGNLPYLYNACLGIYYTKFKQIEKGTSGTQHLVQKFGYDTKQAMHCYRVLDFLIRFADLDFKDFKKVIWYNDTERELLLNIKNGKVQLDTMKEFINETKDTVEIHYKDFYMSNETNVELYRDIEERTKRMVKVMMLR